MTTERAVELDPEGILAPVGDADPSTVTPVTVLTGFLGAGKTTLVNRILAEEHGLRLAVIVNDFGEIAVDSELILGIDSGTVSLANGCVCCEVRDDLVGAVASVLRQDGELDGIVLEASGVAEPLGIARTFTSSGISGLVRLDGIVAVVDAEQLPDQVAHEATADLVYGQIGCSDLVLLNKIDLADRARIDQVRAFVHGRLPAVRVIETTFGNAPFGVLVGTTADEDRVVRLDRAADHDHRHSFVSWIYRREGAFEPAAIVRAIAEMPRSVYRIKGFLHDRDDPERRQLVQAVGMRAEVRPHDSWGDRAPATELVVIADGDNVDRAEVEHLLDGCRT